MKGFVFKRSPSHLILVTVCWILAIGTYGWYDHHFNESAQEIVSAWVESEKPDLQQGNYLPTVTKSNRLILASDFAKGVMLYDFATNQPLITLGEQFVPSFENLPLGLSMHRASLFSRNVWFRFPWEQNLGIVFHFYSIIGMQLFALLSTLLMVLIIGMYVLLKRVSKREEGQRLEAVGLALDYLIQGQKPAPDLINQIPTIDTVWSDLLKRINTMKDEFANSVADAATGRLVQQISHDLRGNLGVFEHLQYHQGDLTTEHRHAISSALTRIQDMVNSLKTPVTDGIGPLVPCVINWTSIPSNFQFDPIASKIKTRFDGFEDLAHAIADEKSLYRAAMNMIKNAREAAKSEVKVIKSQSGNILEINVLDDGPGLTPDATKVLFQKWGTSGKQGGTGLGLFYAQKIAAAHGGSISYTRENGWTKFQLSLPILTESPAATIPKSGDNSPKIESEYARCILIIVSDDKLKLDLARALSNCNIEIFNHNEASTLSSVDLVYTDDLATFDSCLSQYPQAVMMLHNPTHSVEKIAAMIQKRMEWKK